MDWVNYKKCCDRPCVFSRWALTVSISALPEELAEPLNKILLTEPLPKPADHKAPPDLDMFVLNASSEYVSAVLASLSERAHLHLASSLKPNKIDHLLVVWREFDDYVSAN